jgi:excisionase family DNA binding protein
MVRRTYTVDEAAGVLGISRSTAYECVKSGELPSLRFRRRIVIPAHALEQLISASPETSHDGGDRRSVVS